MDMICVCSSLFPGGMEMVAEGGGALPDKPVDGLLSPLSALSGCAEEAGKKRVEVNMSSNVVVVVVPESLSAKSWLRSTSFSPIPLNMSVRSFGILLFSSSLKSGIFSVSSSFGGESCWDLDFFLRFWLFVLLFSSSDDAACSFLDDLLDLWRLDFDVLWPDEGTEGVGAVGAVLTGASLDAAAAAGALGCCSGMLA